MNVGNAMKKHTIRKANIDDVEQISGLLFALKKLYGSCTEETSSEFSCNYHQAIAKAIDNPNSSPIIVATDDSDEIVGFLSGTVRHVIRLAGSVGVFEEVFVKKEWRQLGIGKAMADALESEFARLGVHSIEMVSSLAHPGQRDFAQSIGIAWYSNTHRKTLR